MNTKITTATIVQAAQSQNTYEAALAYHQMGFSVLPLKGKRPSCPFWKRFQDKSAPPKIIDSWHQKGLLENVGIVCGAVSDNLVVLDLDGVAGYPAFVAQFPHLAETYTVATGGGVGKHVYWQVDTLPVSIKAMETPIGNLEICANGRQVVAPPSRHPKTGIAYAIEKPLDILNVPNLEDLVAWVESFKAKVTQQLPRFSQHNPNGDVKINPRVVQAIEDHFVNRKYKQMRDWLHGQCIYPHRHKNGDRHASFGFNLTSHYGYCHVCGTILAKDVCEAIGIDPNQCGGLIEKPQHVKQDQIVENKSSLNLLEIPPDEPDKPPSISQLALPDWLQMYLEWAGTAGNETPMSFHLGAALWLLSVAIGRRLYAPAPWGVKIFPNLYLMIIGSTTFYRKSTAYKLAEQIAREAIPHMLMPTPGSPERFQEALSGRLPANFNDLTETQKERLKKAQPFAAQRGLLKDEVAGLFGAINKRDYMVGLKDMLMELYDCPEYSDKETQAGLTIVENAALSIFGVTTPSSLSSAISQADWSNGLLIRFGLLTPEPDYIERPASEYYQQPPPELIRDLRLLNERLPQPEQTEDGLKPPKSIEFDVECWAACRAYGAELRQLCNPAKDNQLDERLKGIYGRMHVQAFKLAELLAALDWLDSDSYTPTITVEHWESAKGIAEQWRASAARLLSELDKSGDAVQERREQDRLLRGIQRAGQVGIGLRELYRNLNLPAKRARQMTQELVKAGLIVERQFDRAEWYVATQFANTQTV